VKAFNTTGAANMASAKAFNLKPMMPVAGDDAGAKRIAMDLAAVLGFEPVDAGPLAVSRLLEPMAMFWIKQAIVQGAGDRFALALTRR
jgi:predicted dinucleotide-binding enzyme